MNQARFDRQLASGGLVLTLVGMSNVGKSYWSQRLEESRGFRRFCCDDMIEDGLREILDKLGYRGIEDVSKWLGQPYDKRFPANQRAYLDLEAASLEAIITELDQKTSPNVVIDTTGSVVHLDRALRQVLCESSLVVYIQLSENERQKMFERYLAEPKPVVWGDIYRPKSGESTEQALRSCYPELLAYRDGLYQDMAQITIAASALVELSADGFLDLVRQSLPAR